MRSLFVYSDFPTDKNQAIGNFVYEEASHLTASGNTILASRNKSTPQEGVITPENIFVHGFNKSNKRRVKLYIPTSTGQFSLFFPQVYRHPRGFQSLLEWSKTVQKLGQNFKPDIIHAHFAYPEGYVAALANCRLKKPFIVTLRGVDILMESSVGYGARLNKSVDTVIRKVLDRATVLIAVSRPIKEEALKLMKEDDGKKVIYVPNGVDIRKFHPVAENAGIRKSLGLPIEKPIVLTVRHLKPKMGLEYLIKSAKLITKKYPDTLFVICGRDRGSLPTLQQLVSTLELSQNVIFAGEVPRDKVSEYYQACDIFVIPSLQEGFPNAALEAMASAKPVVATQVGALVDIIKNGKTGLLVEPKNHEMLYERILYLMEKREEAIAMGKNAREDIARNYSLDIKMDHLQNIYKELLS